MACVHFFHIWQSVYPFWNVYLSPQLTEVIKSVEGREVGVFCDITIVWMTSCEATSTCSSKRV